MTYAEPDVAMVRIPSPLRRVTGGWAEVEVTAGPLRDVLAELESRFPGMRSRLLDAEERLHGHVHVFVGEQDIRSTDGLDTSVTAGDVVSIVPAVAGG